ncbi:MAG: response regulator transcription factor, partial [Nitrospirales bacterium]
MAPKIVVIEDREDVVRVLKTYLEPEGFQVVAAATGEEGLRLVTREKPDVLILDLVLPGLDGLEVCRRLRRDPETAQLPILILSGKGEATDRVTGLEVGADDYVAKPFNATEMVSRVKALLRRASGSHAVRMLREGSIELDIDRYTVSVEGRPVKLTAKEFDLLRALLEAKGRTLT